MLSKVRIVIKISVMQIILVEIIAIFIIIFIFLREFLAI